MHFAKVADMNRIFQLFQGFKSNDNLELFLNHPHRLAIEKVHSKKYHHISFYRILFTLSLSR